MTFALLPVKDPRAAKQRLRSMLGEKERERLSRALYENMMGVLRAARGLDGILVATSDRQVADHARGAGAVVLEEADQRGHSHSADAAARHAMTLGAARVLMVPIDVPLATPAEIEQLLAVRDADVVIVPSADGTGTNALLRTPPDVIASCFGPGSFRRHAGEAQAKGARFEVMRPPGLVFDIDTPEDVRDLLRRAPGSPIARLLSAQCRSAS
ncbi:MAG: 2-phospho-L-lactate guanylyltransferase [Bryobacterales bacterium]|nr:2-phospho-L-lactate guanylyltransferase [Bryobacterales bacterium]